MPDRDFLQRYPLYRRYNFKVPSSLYEIRMPAIKMPCDTCKSDQTFNLRAPDSDGPRRAFHASTSALGPVIDVAYACASCSRYTYHFLILVDASRTFVEKVGQFPPWDISSDHAVDALLGDHAFYFKRGLILESQGYGIGAFAYYRRIIDEIIDDLLNQIADLLSTEEQGDYASAFERARETKVTSEKIALVKDLLPPILKPDGINPLGTLHDVLSEGLHAESDESCLQLAMTVRECLVFLASQVSASRSNAKEFTQRMRQLLDRKQGGRQPLAPGNKANLSPQISTPLEERGN